MHMHMLYDKSFGIPRIMRDVSNVIVWILRILKSSSTIFNRDLKVQRFEDFAADPQELRGKVLLLEANREELSLQAS